MEMLEALKKRYEAQIAEAKVPLKIYLSNNPVLFFGISFDIDDCSSVFILLLIV